MEEAFKINQKSTKQRNDSAVQGTNDSSILSKISMCQTGYFDDDFLKYFATKCPRRSPLVNRGYYIRMKLVDFVFREFLKVTAASDANRRQLISLGAGFDSIYFRLKHQNLLDANTLFIEIDFPDVIKRKISIIKSTESLNALCPDLNKATEVNQNILYRSESTNYALIGMDMRNTQLLDAFLKSIPTFAESTPTLLLSEVVLTYMAVNSGNSLLKWVAETFSNCALAIYEQIHPDDPFGQVMIAHFKKLGSPLKCVAKYPTEYHQMKRHVDNGFDACFSIKAMEFYLNNVTFEEKCRIERLELFDEYEQWHLKCCHYSFVFATNGQFCKSFVQHDLLKSNGILGKCSDLNLSEILNDYDREREERVDKLKVKVSELPAKFGLRTGHSLFRAGRKLFVLGGFGESLEDTSGKHKRLTSIEIIDIDDFSVKITDPADNLVADRVFQACASVTDENDSTSASSPVLVFYGRSNPSKIFQSIIRVDVTNNENLSFAEILPNVLPDSSASMLLPRFRHACCSIGNSKFLFSCGKQFEKNDDDNDSSESNSNRTKILNDVFSYDLISNELKQLTFDNHDIIVGRHSHSMCTWNSKQQASAAAAIISGGLTIDERALNDLLLCVVAENDDMKSTVRELKPIKGTIHARYAHTSHVIDDTLILIGGVNGNDKPPGICMVDLNTLQAHEFDVPTSASGGAASEPLMLVNHQSIVIDKNTILIVGGGGACFTFGTHLNRQPVYLDITSCWTHHHLLLNQNNST